MTTKFIVCSFDSTSDLCGKKRTYKALKAAALAAGRFSTFEATASMRDARMFTKLENDPEVETFDMGFPWRGVRLRLATGTAVYCVRCGANPCTCDDEKMPEIEDAE